MVALSKVLPRTDAGRHISQQLLRSGTSAGANYEEARAAESRADFVHKVRVATKELRETLYWLRLLRRSALVDASLEALEAETNQLIAILTSSAKTARTPS